MKRAIGAVVLGLSACGYPLTEAVIRRWGRGGAAVAESACAGLAIRDAVMVVGGVPARLGRLPATLLYLELATAMAASAAGLRPLLSACPADQAAGQGTGAAERGRRAAVAALFTLHTIRFAIYLSRGQGRARPG